MAGRVCVLLRRLGWFGTCVKPVLVPLGLRTHSGQLGHGDLARRSQPTIVEALEKLRVVRVACGEIHAAALDE